MAEKTYGGVTVDVDADGFMTDPGQWTKRSPRASRRKWESP